AFVRAGHTGGGIQLRYLADGDNLLSWSRKDGSARLWAASRARLIEHFPDGLLALPDDGKNAVLRRGLDVVLVGRGAKGRADGPKLDSLAMGWRGLSHAVFSADG